MLKRTEARPFSENRRAKLPNHYYYYHNNCLIYSFLAISIHFSVEKDLGLE